MLVEGALLTPAREKISSTPIQELLYDLREGILTPVQVLEAFQAKALHVDKEINAVCDFIESARAWAVELETVPESERKSLYGLPVSVKVRGHYLVLLCIMTDPRNVSTWLVMTAPLV